MVCLGSGSGWRLCGRVVAVRAPLKGADEVREMESAALETRSATIRVQLNDLLTAKAKR